METMLRVTMRGVMKMSNSLRLRFIVEFLNKNPSNGMRDKPGTSDFDIYSSVANTPPITVVSPLWTSSSV